jgi:hypothetical protein
MVFPNELLSVVLFIPCWYYEKITRNRHQISMLQLNKVERNQGSVRSTMGSPSGMGPSENNQGDIPCSTFNTSPSHAADLGGIGIGIGWSIPAVNLVRMSSISYFIFRKL